MMGDGSRVTEPEDFQAPLPSDSPRCRAVAAGRISDFGIRTLPSTVIYTYLHLSTPKTGPRFPLGN